MSSITSMTGRVGQRSIVIPNCPPGDATSGRWLMRRILKKINTFVTTAVVASTVEETENNQRTKMPC